MTFSSGDQTRRFRGYVEHTQGEGGQRSQKRQSRSAASGGMRDGIRADWEELVARSLDS